MAARAKPRITRDKLKCGDLIFFGPKGPSSSVESIYHAALYLGRGWFIHSTGSSDGVTLASLNNSSYWKAAFAWGRRVLTPAELVLPTPSPTASAAPVAAPAPESRRRRRRRRLRRRPSAAVTPAPVVRRSPDTAPCTPWAPRRCRRPSVLCVSALHVAAMTAAERPWALTVYAAGAARAVLAVCAPAAPGRPARAAAAPADAHRDASPAGGGLPGQPATVQGTAPTRAPAPCSTLARRCERPAARRAGRRPAPRPPAATAPSASPCAPSVSTDYRVVYERRRPAGGPGGREPASCGRVVTTVVPGQPLAGRLGRAARAACAPAHPGGTVVIDRRVGGVWRAVPHRHAGRATRASRSRGRPDAFGYYRLRARMDADAGHDSRRGHLRSSSSCNRPNAHRVPMRYAHYIVIVRHEYRLYYYEHGVLVRALRRARSGAPATARRSATSASTASASRPAARSAPAPCSTVAGRHRHPRHERAVAARPAYPARLLTRLRAHRQRQVLVAVRARARRHAVWTRAADALTPPRALAAQASSPYWRA